MSTPESKIGLSKTGLLKTGLSETETERSTSPTVKERAANLDKLVQANKLPTPVSPVSPVSSTTVPTVKNNVVNPAQENKRTTPVSPVSKDSKDTTVPSLKDTTVPSLKVPSLKDTTVPSLKVPSLKDTTVSTDLPLAVLKNTATQRLPGEVEGLIKNIANELGEINKLHTQHISAIKNNNYNEITKIQNKTNMLNTGILQSAQDQITQLLKEQENNLNKAIENETNKAVVAAGKYYKYKQKYLQLKNNTL